MYKGSSNCYFKCCPIKTVCLRVAILCRSYYQRLHLFALITCCNSTRFQFQSRSDNPLNLEVDMYDISLINAVFAALLLVSSQAKNPGIRFRVTDNGLQYGESHSDDL